MENNLYTQESLAFDQGLHKYLQAQQEAKKLEIRSCGKEYGQVPKSIASVLLPQTEERPDKEMCLSPALLWSFRLSAIRSDAPLL